MTDSRPVVKTIGLTKVFKDFWRRDKVVAVQDLDLEVRPGEVFGLLGPNGSGKSTTIKMLLGLLHPTRGRISIFGRPPTDVASKARIGYLPEESYLYRYLDARETLQLYGKLFRQARQVRGPRIEKLLDMVGLQHQARRRIGEYSKGMARRIGLAQALINDPDFLILDEPTTGMDPIGTQQIKELIRELGRRGKTILLSSHLLADVQDVCDRICVLYGGQARACGPLDDLLSQTHVTQLSAERLSPQTIEQIREVVRARENKPVAVDHPRERLENFFVRIVQEAQSSIATSGAQAGGALPDFLSEPEGVGVIEDLMLPDQPRTRQPLTARPAAPEPQPAEEVLDDLMSTGAQRREPAAPAGEPAPPPRRREDEVDRDLIDSLIDSEERRSG